MYKKLKCHLDANNIYYETNVDLKKKTWIHRGGVCDLFISPRNSSELQVVVKYLYLNDFKFQLLGHTSNVYILNTTNIPIIVSTMKCCKYELFTDKIICESGASVIRIANDMIKQGVAGFEYLTGLPGTIGAAIYNNSSCKSNSISHMLISAEVLLEDGSLVTMTSDDMKFSFRSSVFKDKQLKGVIVKVILKVEHGDADLLQKIAKSNNDERGHRLEGNAKNLGCTVNRCFINGRMPLFYYLSYHIYRGSLRLIGKTEIEAKSKAKDFLCKISGYGEVSPYISNKNPIIFVWKDSRADELFPQYLKFMAKVYKTDKLEIEVI